MNVFDEGGFVSDKIGPRHFRGRGLGIYALEDISVRFVFFIFLFLYFGRFYLIFSPKEAGSSRLKLFRRVLFLSLPLLSLFISSICRFHICSRISFLNNEFRNSNPL